MSLDAQVQRHRDYPLHLQPRLQLQGHPHQLAHPRHQSPNLPSQHAPLRQLACNTSGRSTSIQTWAA